MNTLVEKPFNPGTMISDTVGYKFKGCPVSVELEPAVATFSAVLTAEHAASSYGIPVLVIDDVAETVIGSGELYLYGIKAIVATPYTRAQAEIALDAKYQDAGYPIASIEFSGDA